MRQNKSTVTAETRRGGALVFIRNARKGGKEIRSDHSGHQRCACLDAAGGLPDQNVQIPVAVGHHHRCGGVQLLAGELVQVAFHQQLPGGDGIPFLDMEGKAFAVQVDGFKADVDEQLDSVAGGQGNGMAAGNRSLTTPSKGA